jgi:hypothetical protein
MGTNGRTGKLNVGRALQEGRARREEANDPTHRTMRMIEEGMGVMFPGQPKRQSVNEDLEEDADALIRYATAFKEALFAETDDEMAKAADAFGEIEAIVARLKPEIMGAEPSGEESRQRRGRSRTEAVEIDLMTVARLASKVEMDAKSLYDAVQGRVRDMKQPDENLFSRWRGAAQSIVEKAQKLAAEFG